MENGKLTESGTRRVVWIPEKLDKEIEDLRHTIGYTRSGFYRYAIIRLLEDFLLHKPKKERLGLWEELIGTFEDLKVTKDEVIVTVSTSKRIALSYPTNSQEAQILTKALKGIQRGVHVSILKTDIPSKPIILNILRNNSSCKKSFIETAVSIKSVSVFTQRLIR